MNAASFSNFQGGWVDWVISAIRLRRGIRSQSSSSSTTIASGAKPEQADDLGVLRRAEQDDRVALLDELCELALLLDDPGAGAVDDLEAARLGALHHLGLDAVGADDDGRAVIDVVERVDGLDAERPGGRGSRPRCGRPGRGCASACRPPPTPWPCRSPRGRRSRSRCASRFGRPRRFPCRVDGRTRGRSRRARARSSQVADSARPDGARVDAPVAGVEQGRDPAHDRGRGERSWRRAGRRPRGCTSATRNGDADTDA